jgi:hypothetical protein
MTPALDHATSNANATRTRIGKEREEKIGATEKTASTRMNGQKIGDNHWSSKVSEIATA